MNLSKQTVNVWTEPREIFLVVCRRIARLIPRENRISREAHSSQLFIQQNTRVVPEQEIVNIDASLY